MHAEDWPGWLRNRFPVISRDTANHEQWLVLTPATTQGDLSRAEHVLGHLAEPRANVVSTLLECWDEQGVGLLLEIVPRLLNPGVAVPVLNPTGKSMQELFPQFCLRLQQTEEFAILIDLTLQGEIVLVGRSRYGSDGSREWAYYLPNSLEDLALCEVQTGVHFSPQLRQMYIRAGGALGPYECPYFARPEELTAGFLYTEFYCDLAADLQLSAETVERLQAFVVLSQNGTGDAQGFFADGRDYHGTQNNQAEYTLYEWNHETTRFSWWATDFAEAVNRELLGRWLME